MKRVIFSKSLWFQHGTFSTRILTIITRGVNVSSRYENKSIKEEMQSKHERHRLANKLIGGKYYTKPSPLPITSLQFEDVRKSINSECKSVSEIFGILQSNNVKRDRMDHTVYVCAMKRCERLSKHWKPSEAVFTLMTDNGVDRNVIVYNEWFKILIKVFTL